MTMNTARQIAMDAFPGRTLCVHYQSWHFASREPSSLYPWTLTVFHAGDDDCEQVTGVTFDACISKMREIIYPLGPLADGDVGVEDPQEVQS